MWMEEVSEKTKKVAGEYQTTLRYIAVVATLTLFIQILDMLRCF